jgi:hypothetical protein
VQKWGYLFVTFQVHKFYRPKEVNGKELQDWKRGPSMIDYFNQLGEEGWELVRLKEFSYGKEVEAIFKRPK